MEGYQFRLANKSDLQTIVAFIDAHWGARTPLIHHPDFFAYYYQKEDRTLRFALAEQQGQIVALAGYIPASQQPKPDVWVSIWIANKKAKGSGLELMAALPELLNCRILACNNIRPNTRPFYEFLGYTTGQMSHFYRLADKSAYQLAQVSHKTILPTGGNARFQLYPSFSLLEQSGFVPSNANRPYKDMWYIHRRYFSYPHQTYQVYGAILPGQIIPAALLILRVIQAQNTTVLRISDFIGNPSFFAECGTALAALLAEYNAEYADLYCVGIADDTAHAAGFCKRDEKDPNIIPNYLSPPLLENTDYYYFTNQPESFTMFKADGDQDRPNVDF